MSKVKQLKSEAKELIAHAKRMAKRPQYQVDFDETYKFVGLSPNWDHMLGFKLELMETFKSQGYVVTTGAIILPQYFNDTFRQTGAAWWEDIKEDVLKVSIEIETVGTMHFYQAKDKTSDFNHNHDRINNFITLDLIQAQTQNAGLGTLMMNTMLDTADKTNDTIATYPCDISPITTSLHQAKCNTIKLRNWFQEFSFDTRLDSARMLYTAK
mgnify:CR=1 FL=1|tara:strand:+ start:45 stop:680 length:636 start_codon:yes stop_codon:yes gene_type:complete